MLIGHHLGHADARLYIGKSRKCMADCNCVNSVAGLNKADENSIQDNVGH